MSRARVNRQVCAGFPSLQRCAHECTWRWRWRLTGSQRDAVRREVKARKALQTTGRGPGETAGLRISLQFCVYACLKPRWPGLDPAFLACIVLAQCPQSYLSSSRSWISLAPLSPCPLISPLSGARVRGLACVCPGMLSPSLLPFLPPLVCVCTVIAGKKLSKTLKFSRSGCEKATRHRR